MIHLQALLGKILVNVNAFLKIA